MHILDFSENSKFSKICQNTNAFIEPEMIDRMGDKASAKPQ
jgi:hypothetical protein